MEDADIAASTFNFLKNSTLWSIKKSHFFRFLVFFKNTDKTMKTAV